MKRYGSIGRLNAEGYEAYKRLHAAVWPQVQSMIKDCNIQNYTIFHHDGLLFSYLEYSGDDFESDMAKMESDEQTQQWWQLLRTSLETWGPREQGQWWAEAEELFHLD